MIMQITSKGRRALTDDTSMEPLDRLILEIAARTENVSAKHLFELAARAVEASGGIEAAIIAIKAGEVRFELCTRGLQ
jgi:hypothetical protein